MTRTTLIAAAALAVATSSAAAQGGRHPLVGQWKVNCAGPVAQANGESVAPATALLTIAQDGNQLVATLETPSARASASSTTHVLRGVVVGDSAQFTFNAPTRINNGRHHALRDTQVRWLINAQGGELSGTQLRVLTSTSQVLTPTPLAGTRIGS
jgi:hypothetical protein